MQTGTEILLARMKEYPEEFNDGLASRWMNIISEAKSYLPGEDVRALEDGLRQMRVDRFNERVLARLAGEDKSEQSSFADSARYNVGWNDPQADALRQKQLYESQYQIQQNLAAQGMSTQIGTGMNALAQNMGIGQSTLAQNMASVPKGFFK
jgi:hypothetical protein